MYGMTWRMISGPALVLALGACGDSESGNPPPVGSGPMTLTAADTGQMMMSSGGSDESTAGNDTMTMGTTSSSMDDSTTGPPEMFTVISGEFVDGGGGVQVPIECRIRFWAPGHIEPSTGVDTGEFLFQRGGFVVDEFPQAYSISNDEVSMIDFGMVGYAGAQCDADANGQFDDDVGGFYPTLPLEQITVPSSGVDFAIAPL